MDVMYLGCFVVLACAIALYAASVPQGNRGWWIFLAAIVALVVASKLIGGWLIGAIVLDLAELAAVALVWSRGTPQAAAAGRLYLFAIVPAIVCTLIALALIGTRRSSAGPVDRNPRGLAGDLRLRLEAWPDPLFLLASRCGVRRRADDDGADRISGRHRDLRRVGGAARRRAVDLQRARDRVAHRRAAVDVRRRGARARPDRAQADAGVSPLSTISAFSSLD